MTPSSKSFINITYNRGSKTDPCGSPLKMIKCAENINYTVMVYVDENSH